MEAAGPAQGPRGAVPLIDPAGPVQLFTSENGNQGLKPCTLGPGPWHKHIHCSASRNSKDGATQMPIRGRTGKDALVHPRSGTFLSHEKE